jgi:urea carboxylase
VADPAPLGRVLVANRGEIACRIIRTLTRIGRGSVAVFSDADAGAPHVRMAGAAQRLGPAPALESYLRADLLIAAALEHGADGIHPGYGFLSEDPDFAAAVEEAGLAFCGPTPEQIRAFGRKDSARALARAAGVPLLPGSDPLDGPEDALRAAEAIGYPVMVKSTTGGGGIGMSVCDAPGQLVEAIARIERLGRTSVGGAQAFLERHVPRARHVEVQIVGDGRGRVLALGDRDCSLQRRHQKVVEEAPAPGLADGLRARLAADAVRLAELVGYRSAGTVEFLLDADTGEAHFLEVNTRLQVEHGVTEEVRGIDLVEAMVRIAGGEPVLEGLESAAPAGHAIEARVYAEDPTRDHRPSSGRLTHVRFPEGVRVDTWVEDGSEVTPHYDPLLAKVVVRGADRVDALARMRAALADTELFGLETNLGLLRAAVDDGPFASGSPTTAALSALELRPATVEVLAGRRARDDAAGPPGAPRLLGRRRAPVGADGRSQSPSRQPGAGEPGGRPRPRDDAHRPHAAVRPRCAHLPRGRPDGGGSRRWRGAVVGRGRGAPRPDPAPRSRAGAGRARVPRRRRRLRRPALPG